MSEKQKPAQDDYVISNEALKKAEEYIEEEEGAINRYRGPLATLMTACAVVMSLFHLYAAIEIVPAYILRPVHVAFALTLVFLLFPAAPRFRHRLMWWDVIFAIASIAIVVYILYWGDELGDRATLPTLLDQVFGVSLILLILEGNRRSSTWILPFVVCLFLAYALFGPYLPAPWTHKGYEISRLTGSLYMTLEGIFGVAVDVSSTLIILFTIFGAFLQVLGRGQILHRLFLRGDGRQAFQRGTGGGHGLVPAGRAIGFRGRHHGDDRLGRLSAARQVGIRQRGRRRIAGGRRAGRHHFTAGARRRRVPDRGVPQDLVSRRDPDGDHPDDPVLSRDFRHGRDRRAQVRHEDGGAREASSRRRAGQALLVSLRVAGGDRRVHAARLLAGAVGVLGDGRDVRAVIFPERYGARFV